MHSKSILNAAVYEGIVTNNNTKQTEAAISNNDQRLTLDPFLNAKIVINRFKLTKTG